MHEWACLTASGTQPLVFIDNVIADGRSMNSERYRAIFSIYLVIFIGPRLKEDINYKRLL